MNTATNPSTNSTSSLTESLEHPAKPMLDRIAGTPLFLHSYEGDNGETVYVIRIVDYPVHPDFAEAEFVYSKDGNFITANMISMGTVAEQIKKANAQNEVPSAQ